MLAITNRPPPNLTAAECAEWLGVTDATFHKIWPKLAAEHGFPMPIPGLGKRVWSVISLNAWLLSLLSPAGRRAIGQAVSPEPEPVTISIEKLLEERTERIGEAA